MIEAIEENSDVLIDLIDKLSDKEADLDLEFDQMELELEDSIITVSGKTKISFEAKDV